MLQLSLSQNEYFTIDGEIVVCLSRIIAGNRCNLAIEADRNIPIVRGTLREKNGEKRPDCIEKPLHTKAQHYKKDTLFRWNETRESAVCEMEKLAEELEQAGKLEQADCLRAQIDCLIPEPWEDEEPL